LPGTCNLQISNYHPSWFFVDNRVSLRMAKCVPTDYHTD
jgi:hypothetical protein